MNKTYNGIFVMQVARYFAFLLTVFSTGTGFSFSLNIHWQFTHVVKGYDWDNRLEIYLDGKPFATSAIYKQSAAGTVLIDIPPGKHTLELSDFVWYKGDWEENTVENDYAIDASVVKELDIEADAELNVTFDIAKAKTTVKLTKPKKPAQKETSEAPFTVSWKYEQVIGDHDYENRMVVYIDGKREAESAATPQSIDGRLTFQLPSGSHKLRFQTEVLYEGKWEEQIRQFDYSIDGFYELRKFSTDRPASLQLTFNLETATVVPDLKK